MIPSIYLRIATYRLRTSLPDVFAWAFNAKTFSVWVDVLCFFKICNKPKNAKFFWFDFFRFIFSIRKKGGYVN